MAWRRSNSAGAMRPSPEMPPPRVVPAFDVAEERDARFGLALEGTAIEQFALEASKKLSAMALSWRRRRFPSTDARRASRSAHRTRYSCIATLGRYGE